jgi:hypothetical protein
MTGTHLQHAQGGPPALALCCTHRWGPPALAPCYTHRPGPPTPLCHPRLLPAPAAAPRSIPPPSACTVLQQLQQVAAASGFHCNMCNTRSIFATLRRNTCNIHPKQLKHLQHTSKAPENTCVAIAKYMQHLDETFKTYI